MVRPLGGVMVIGLPAISRFATGAPCTKKCPVAPESDIAYSTACFGLVVLKIVPAFGSSWSSCCVTMDCHAFFAHRLFGRKTGVTILLVCSGFSQFGSHLGMVVWSMWASVSLHCKRKTPTYCWYIRRHANISANMPAICHY